MKFPEWFYWRNTCFLLPPYSEGSHSKYSHWAAMHLAQLSHSWKHFWNTCSASVTFFWLPSVSWNLCPFKADYFWKQPEVILSQIRGTGWVFHFSKEFLSRNLFDSTLWAGTLSQWNGETNRWAKVLAFFYSQLHVTTSVFLHNTHKLGWLTGLVEWIESE
jgi:hypothetical protein